MEVKGLGQLLAALFLRVIAAPGPGPALLSEAEDTENQDADEEVAACLPWISGGPASAARWRTSAGKWWVATASAIAPSFPISLGRHARNLRIGFCRLLLFVGFHVAVVWS
jgi:hypothetical protein